MTAAVRAPVLAYVALGGNLGDAKTTVCDAMDQLADLPHTRLCMRSSLYRTAPVDASGPDFINAVVALHTGLTAPALLVALQQIEVRFGRQRSYQNAPRTLDLDVLLYGSAHIHSANLVVPHPRMGQRAFVLMPLAEIAPDMVNPTQLVAVATQGIERLLVA